MKFSDIFTLFDFLVNIFVDKKNIMGYPFQPEPNTLYRK